jgi:hypothetical protein
MNYGSGSFLFTTNFKKFINKIMVGEEAIVNCYNFNSFTKVKKGNFGSSETDLK